MAKYLLLKHYRSAARPAPIAWRADGPVDAGGGLRAHAVHGDFAARLEGTGEFVDAQALSPEGTFVRYDGEGRPPVTDGPFAETKDLIAGWMVIDVDSLRAGGRAGRRAVRGSRVRAASRSTSGLRCARSCPRRRPSRSDTRWTRPCCGTLTPTVIGVLVRRGADFAAAEDAVQEALVGAAARVAGRSAARSEGLAGHGRVAQVPRRRPRRRLAAGAAKSPSRASPRPARREAADDTLQLYFLCAHPSLTPASAVALTLRAVGGLTTRQIAQAYLVPEATMAQRISRAKRPSRGSGSTSPATSPPCCACSTSSSTRGTAETSTWRPRRSASPASSPP